MRAVLGWALVLGSLVFSVGGVAVVGLADGSGQPQAQAQAPAVTPPAAQTPAMPKLSTAAPKECKPPQRLEARTVPLKPSGVVVINTRGYNYVRPGEYQPSPTSEPPPAPPAAPAPN